MNIIKQKQNIDLKKKTSEKKERRKKLGEQ